MEKAVAAALPLNPLSETKSYTYEKALKEAGFGRAQVILMFLCGFAMMSSINESMGMGLILPASQCDLELDLNRKGIIGGVVFVGVLISTHFWGYQTDLRGRRAVLRVSLLATTVCSFATSFVNSFHLMVVLRFLVGLFVSASGSAAIVYLGEFCPSNRRGQMILYACAIAGFGSAYVAVIDCWILSYEWSIVITESFTIRPWRLLFLLNGLPGLISGLAFWCYPESPRFLLAEGRHDEALEVLCWIHQQNKQASFAVYSLTTELDQKASNKSDQGIGWFRRFCSQVSPLLETRNSINLMVCCVQSVTLYVTYGGLGMWFPQIMNLVFSSSESSTGDRICSILQSNSTTVKAIESSTSNECDDTFQPETFIYSFALGTMTACNSLLNSCFLTLCSEKTLLYINMIVAGCAGIALQYITHSYSVAILFCVEINVAAVCIVLVRSMQVSLFPTQLRATAVSLTSLVGRIGQIIANMVTGVLIVYHCTLTLYFVAGLLFVSAGLNALVRQQ
ncbi:synaptic vesicle glycoprotein 2A-like [Malaya genurostris]|uniref:synaptic vesicle glycoprotein 2A-like n=1 Tax=Malaya genurostris TaxID=325434 RepID=UPI0026F38AD0|nr:synaptic vesicle glycoprotein 2A-like [Malaya genurostris]